jgi:hypothetical protein
MAHREHCAVKVHGMWRLSSVHVHVVLRAISVRVVLSSLKLNQNRFRSKTPQAVSAVPPSIMR